MRYDDIPVEKEGFDPLLKNVTTSNPKIIGGFAQETDVYLRVDDGKRIKVITDINGKGESTFDELKMGQVITFEYKNGSKYEPFWTEKIRE